MSKKKIIFLSVFFVIVVFCVWDIFIDPPAWWRFDRQKDKRAILDYVENTYPDNIKRKGGKFPLQMPAGPLESSIMYFELDGVNFAISAYDGRIGTDGYHKARAEAQFDKIIQDGFLKPRGIKATSIYRFFDDYEIYPYTGGLRVTLSVFDQGSKPEEIEWLYDFYKYWKAEGEFLTEYSVIIRIVEKDETLYHIFYNNMDEFSDESEFNAAFRLGPRTV